MSPYLESILIQSGVNILLALSFYVPRSVGLLALGQHAFMAIGAYTLAILTTRYEVPFHLAVLTAGAMAAGVGVVTGLAALRLKGLYLAILTLAFGEITAVFFVNWDFAGGAEGIYAIPTETNLWVLYGFIGFFCFLLYRFSTSRSGRAWQAVRDNEDVAEAFGVHLFREKTIAYGLGAFLAGVAGAFFAGYMNYIEPHLFSFGRMIDICVFVVFGGVDIFWGPVMGALALTLIPESARFL
ncbi:MAG: branched-chain amino acid ABC transporter permease, partial [Deltaproteobacteria bacterium]|nr:branched-chain amino acid ABC transporter permease [Deltaproteobacteria bacterium]